MKKIILTRTAIWLSTLAVLASISSCYCWRPGNETTKTCATIKNIIDCTKPEVKKQMEAMAPAMIILLAGGAPELDAIAALETVAYAGVMCAADAAKDEALAQLAKPVPTGLTADRESFERRAKAEKVKSNFQNWKTTRHPEIEVKRK
jgi:hypothetical protein